MRGSQHALLLLGPPCGQQHILIRLRGGGPKCLQNLFKNILFDQISMCCWPRILAQIDPNRSFFTLVPPPLRSAIRRDSPPGRGVQLSQNLFKKNTFGTTLGVLLAQDVCQNCSQSKRLHFWAPPFRPEIRRRLPLGCSWLLLAAPGLLLAAPGWSWLLPAAPGCSWLLLAASGCSWLLLFLF